MMMMLNMSGRGLNKLSHCPTSPPGRHVVLLISKYGICVAFHRFTHLSTHIYAPPPLVIPSSYIGTPPHTHFMYMRPPPSYPFHI